MVKSRSESKKSIPDDPSQETEVYKNAKPAPKPANKNAPAFSFLLLLLSLTCLNLLANNLLSNAIRSNISYWFPFMSLPFNKAAAVGAIASAFNIVSIFMGPFSGYLTDLLSPPVTLVIFSTLCASGLLLFLVSLSTNAPTIWITFCLLIYGGAMNQSRIPMQKMCSVLFAGPHISLMMNINHSFSHLSSLSSNLISPFLSENLGVPMVMIVLGTCGLFSLPVCYTIYGLFTSKISVKGSQSRKPLLPMFLEWARSTNVLYWVVLGAGFCVDGLVVAFKNVESYLLKRAFKLSQENSNIYSSSAKVILLITPLFAAIVDRLPFRDFYIFFGALFKVAFCFGMKKLSEMDQTSQTFWYLMILKIADAVFMGLFYPSFYSYYGIFLPKSIRGIGMGINSSVLSISYYTLSNYMNWFDKPEVDALFFFILVSLVGLVFALVALLLNRFVYKNLINAKAKA